jgi:FMNH2-dependent dimethyl sulfone monooxygenase
MRYGYWMPVFGGWLRNVADEGMEASWDYVRDLAVRAETIGYDLTLIAELNLNDIKGVTEPALDAWSTAAAIAAVTKTQELMVAVRPNFHQPALFAKAAANIDRISGGRLSLNVVSSWWADEARSNMACNSMSMTIATPAPPNGSKWSRACGATSGSASKAASTAPTKRSARPSPERPPILYAGGESDAAKTMIAGKCDAYVMHGDPVEVVAPKIADMRGRRADAGGAPMTFGMAAYAIVRDSEAEAKRELARITDVQELPAGYANFDQWLSGTQLERELKLQEYSVSNRGLRPNLVGTPEQLKERIAEYEDAGLDLLLLQMSPQKEEMERFAAQVIAA